MNNLAISYRAAGRLGEALPLFERTLILKKARLGTDHPDTLSTMSALAYADELSGKRDDAREMLEACWPIQQ